MIYFYLWQYFFLYFTLALIWFCWNNKKETHKSRINIATAKNNLANPQFYVTNHLDKKRATTLFFKLKNLQSSFNKLVTLSFWSLASYRLKRNTYTTALACITTTLNQCCQPKKNLLHWHNIGPTSYSRNFTCLFFIKPH